MKTCTTLILCCLVSFTPALMAQVEVEENPLPIGLTDEERTRLHEIGMNHAPTAPPTGDVRNPSEWEPSEGVIVRWPLGVTVALIAEMSEDVVVTTIVPNASSETSARNAYISGGVNMDNAQFIRAATDSIWTRDYGPWFIFEGDKLAIVDHVYNRPRPNDDLIPGKVGLEWGLDVYGMNLRHTGGNHMSNGLGTSSSTELIYIENSSMTEPQVDQFMYDYLGNDYTVLDYIQSGGIHHIDCWAKFLGPSTVLVKDVSPGDPTYDDLNERAAFLASQISPWGVPYDVHRVYCPSGTWYTNSLILNDKVFVPLFGSSQDDDALLTYQEAMPGYEVLGFTGSWATEDALHCRTMGVPDRGTLLIDHMPFRSEMIVDGDYLIAAEIVPLSGEALTPVATRIYYSVNGGLWQSTLLAEGGGPDMFEGFIPEQPEDSLIAYYLEAADDSGRVERHPYIGAPGAHRFSTVCLNHPAVNVSPDGPLYVCPGSGQLLTAGLSGGGGPFSYQWTEDGAPIVGATSPTFTASNSGAHIYNCEVLGDGCVNPRVDASGVDVVWQLEPRFAGVDRVADAQAATCTLDLEWDAAFAPCGGPVSYDIYRSTSPFFVPDESTLLASGATGTGYRDTAGLVHGTHYSYVVRAVDGSNGSSDTNLSQRTAAPTGPGGLGDTCLTGSAVVTVPDGSEGGTSPLRASRNGADLSILWDTTTTECASPGYHLIWGWGAEIDGMAPAGSDCSLGTSGSHLWSTAPDTSSGWAWFLVVGNDGATIEGGWGTDSSSIPRSLEASGECGTVISDTSSCLP